MAVVRRPRDVALVLLPLVAVMAAGWVAVAAAQEVQSDAEFQPFMSWFESIGGALGRAAWRVVRWLRR